MVLLAIEGVVYLERISPVCLTLEYLAEVKFLQVQPSRFKGSSFVKHYPGLLFKRKEAKCLLSLARVWLVVQHFWLDARNLGSSPYVQRNCIGVGFSLFVEGNYAHPELPFLTYFA